MRISNKMRTLLLLCVTALFSLNAAAQQRYYLSTEFGGHWAQALSFVNNSNDRASICDEFINPLYASVDGCTVDNRGEGDGWQTEFGSALGNVGGVAIGMMLSRRGLIAELEYLFTHSHYDEGVWPGSASGATGDKLRQEIYIARERVNGVTGSNLFGNVYYAFLGSNSGGFSPYVGVGAGLSMVTVNYSSVWARNPNPDFISTGTGQPNEEEIKNNLAGTVSAGEAALGSTVFSWQVVVGADYRLSERVSMGVKLRRVDFGDFTSEDLDWNPLRSHSADVRIDGSEPVWANIHTPDLGVVSFSLAMRYWF